MYELGLFLLVPLWQEEPGGKDALAACAAHRHLTGAEVLVDTSSHCSKPSDVLV